MFEGETYKAQVADLYNRAADSFDSIGPRTFSHFGRRLAELAQLNQGDRVLDVATGRGAVLFAAADMVGEQGRAVGVDIASAMVAETGAEASRRRLQNVEVSHMDAEDLHFLDAHFDAVLCAYAVFFFPHLDRALAEFLRVLKPGGMLGLSMSGPRDERWAWYQRLVKAYDEKYDVTVKGGRFLPLTELEEALRRIGFTQVRSVEEAAEFEYDSGEEWWTALWTHGPRAPLERMRPEVLQSFKAEALAGARSLLRSEGRLCLTQRTNFTFATHSG